MIPIVSSEEYLKRMLVLPRPGAEEILAFYDHRVGCMGTDAHHLLIPLDDHLVHRGDGVFETMKFEGQRLYQLAAHLDRMKNSCRALFLDPPCSFEDIGRLLLEIASASKEDDGLITIFVGRGPGGFTVDFRECPMSSLYIVSRRFRPKQDSEFERGFTAFRSEVPAKQSYLSHIKSVDYLPNVLMKREAVLKGYDYPLSFDDQGFLAEGSTENALIVNNQGRIIIPELTHSLAGTTMMRALELIKDEFKFEFRLVQEGDIYEAKELILLGTSFDALSVVRFNGKPIHDVRPGPVSRRMRELLRRDLEINGTPLPRSSSPSGQ